MHQERIILTLNQPAHRELLWTESARQTAKRLNLNVELPKRPEDLRTPEDWRAFLHGANAVITVWETPKLDESILGTDTSIRFVGHAGGSAAGIATPFLFAKDIRICTANKVMAEGVARWCLMMTLIGMRRLLDYAQWGTFRPLVWEHRYPSMSPSETVVGIWGFGDISRSLIHHLKTLDPAKILVCSRSLDPAKARELGLTLVDLETLFEQADVIHLLQSLNRHSEGRIDAAMLRRIRDGAVLINGGRAHLLNESDFLASLRENRYTAITDVHFEEPLPKQSPFRNCPNLIATPHSAAQEASFPYVKTMLEEYDRFRRGEPLQHEISLERALAMTVEADVKPRSSPDHDE